VVHDDKTLRFCSSRAKLPREDQHSYSLRHSLVKMRAEVLASIFVRLLSRKNRRLFFPDWEDRSDG
jgi:hypothetical protein